MALSQSELEKRITDKLARFASLEHRTLFDETVCSRGEYSYDNEAAFDDAVNALRQSGKVIGSKWGPYRLNPAPAVASTPAVTSPSPKGRGLFGGRKKVSR